MKRKLTGDRNQCPGCGQYFNSSFAFDKHRTGDHANNGRHCLDAENMEKKGMVLGDDGFWRGRSMPDSALLMRSACWEDLPAGGYVGLDGNPA